MKLSRCLNRGSSTNLFSCSLNFKCIAYKKVPLSYANIGIQLEVSNANAVSAISLKQF